jgi:hypothetical protein
MKATEPIEVGVSIHDVDGTGLGHQLIEDIDVVQLAVADEDEGRDIAPQIATSYPSGQTGCTPPPDLS